MTDDERRQRLAAWMAAQNMTLTALAESLGLGVSYLSRIANGERRISNSFMYLFNQRYGAELGATIFSCKEAEQL